MATCLIRGRRALCGPWLGLAALGFLSSVARSALADNTPAVFLGHFQDTRFSNPLNWSPQLVPNNVGATHYDVSLPQLPPNTALISASMTVDTDASISNFFIQYYGFQINVVEHNLVVNDAFTGDYLTVIANFADASATFGHYASVSAAGVLDGAVTLQAASGRAATLRFDGANIVASNSSLSLWGPGARIVDKFGNDGLRNLAAIRGTFSLGGGASFTSAGDFYNDWLTIGADGASADVGCFVTGNLLNFDKASHVLSGGTFLFTGQGIRGRVPSLGAALSRCGHREQCRRHRDPVGPRPHRRSVR